MGRDGDRIYLNEDWKFSSEFVQEMTEPGFDDSGMEAVRLPHTNKLLPYNYINVSDYEMISGYRTEVMLGEECLGKTILLTFEGAAHEATVYVNGKQAVVHRCGYTAFTIDISGLAVFHRPNIIAVRLDSRETLNQPPFGHVIDYMTYGGLYREAYIDIKNPVYIDDVYVELKQAKEDGTAGPETGHATGTGAARTGVVGAGRAFEYEITIADKVGIAGQKGYYAEIELYDKDGTYIRSLENCDLSRELRFKETAHTEAAHTEAGKTVTGEPLFQDLRNKLNGREFAGAVGEVNRLVFRHTEQADDLRLWELEDPALYELRVTLKKSVQDTEQEDMVLDTKTVRWGLRTAEFREDGFYLNNRKVKLRGINRHQSYPYAGYAMPESMQVADADIIQRELGMNAVRTSHYPQSKYFLDRCDELGLLVFTEIPGWQHVGDEDWKKVLCQDVEEMILQNRRHPSIILWGVRVNESKDDDALYSMTNKIAHDLDSSRATGGVRYLKKSSLLEDVYTFNDFLYDGDSAYIEKKKDVTTDEKKAYLISEYNGHMYPTKTYDAEEHRMEHAMRHAKVMNAYYSAADVAGGFAWCMFDYNTHKDFGSGDSICYHGITDMYRNPKLAAAVYSCFSENDVLEISSSMDIGEHPAGRLGDVYIFSNADSVKLYKNDEFIKEYQCSSKNIKGKNHFAGLEHPPVLVDDMIGDRLEREEQFSHGKAEDVKKVLAAASKYGMNHIPMDIKMRAAKLMTVHHMKFQDAYDLYGKYIGDWGNAARSYKFEAVKDGKVVKTVIKEPVQSVQITAVADHTDLVEKTTYDVAAIRISARDQNGNLLSFFNEPVMLEASGEIELIGPKVTSLRGGYGGTYVKTTGTAGEGRLTITSEQAGTVEIVFCVQ